MRRASLAVLGATLALGVEGIPARASEAEPLEAYRAVLEHHLPGLAQHRDSLAGAHRQAFEALVRGLARVAARFREVMRENGKTGLGVVRHFRRTVRNALTVGLERGLKLGSGLIRWVDYHVRRWRMAWLKTLRALGAKGLEPVTSYYDEITERMKETLRAIYSGRLKYAPGMLAEILDGFRAKIRPATQAIFTLLQGSPEKARQAWRANLGGFVQRLKAQAKKPAAAP